MIRIVFSFALMITLPAACASSGQETRGAGQGSGGARAAYTGDMAKCVSACPGSDAHCVACVASCVNQCANGPGCPGPDCQSSTGEFDKCFSQAKGACNGNYR